MIIALVTLVHAQSPDGSLDQAYQKEFSYLLAEKKELEGRLAEVRREGETKLDTADRELATLQGRLVSVSRAADRAEDEFDALEREAGSLDDAATLLSTTLQQGGETLELSLPGDAAVALPLLFDAVATRIDAAGRAEWSEDQFFLTTGELVSGRVYRWGQVASWGISAAGSGALAPAGEGRFQLRQSFGADTAAALGQGENPERLELQLYEAEKGAEEAEKKGGLVELLTDAGTMGQVLFALGCVSACLVVVRAVSLAFARRGGQSLVDATLAQVRGGRLDEARLLLGRRGGPTARVMAAILGHADRSKDEIDRVVDEAILKETPGIDRFASALTVITAGAPLLGLLVSVTGMIATFEVITEHGTGNPKLMSAGIAEALICTALGLAVAIPTLLAGNVLASVGDTIKNRIDRAALATLNALEAAASAAPLRRVSGD